MNIQKKIKAIILTADKFEDMEVFYPWFRLKEGGIAVDIAAPKKGHIEGENGYGLNIEMTFGNVNPDKYDLLIIPGGAPNGAPRTVSKSKKAQEIANAFFKLVAANLVRGRRLTSYWHDGVPEEIKQAGGIWEDKEVVVDKNLVTSRWPMDLPFFMREVMKLLKN